jgi:hypothetical protein
MSSLKEILVTDYAAAETRVVALNAADAEFAVVLPSYSRKAAMRCLFWLEKNHWAKETGTAKLQRWMKESMDHYLDSGMQYIHLYTPREKAWCKYELYLERLGYYINKRVEKANAK